MCAISLIILDNHYIYELIVDNRFYFNIRKRVRELKKGIGLSSNIQIMNYTSDTPIKNSEYLLPLEVMEINPLFQIDKKRSEAMNFFLEIYRNSSKQSNVVILGDLIYEYFHNSIDTLIVPFNGLDYCNEILQSKWCHTWNLELLIYPTVVYYDENFNPNLSNEKYISLREKVDVRILGSDNTIINLVIQGSQSIKDINYFYSYENEIFIVPNMQL